MREYRIRTIAGGGLAVFVGGGIITFEIQEVANRRSEYYQYFSADFGFGFKGGAQGPSEWTKFSSNTSIRAFHGYVITETIIGNGGVGYGGFNMDFVSGPAAGLNINGLGWTTGLGASISASHGWMKLHK